MENKFLGSFNKAENESVPLALMSFLATLLQGPSIKDLQPEAEKTKITTSIAQEIMFNSVGRRSQKCESIPRHIKERETPASLYLAMKVFFQSGSESLLNTMHQHGLCIWYDRLRVLGTDMANSMIRHWEDIGVVPPQAIKNVFTTGGYDNIDHNPSSTMAKSGLHGSCISLHQHPSVKFTNLANILHQEELGKTKDERPWKDICQGLQAFYTNIDLDISLPNNEALYVPAMSTVNYNIPDQLPSMLAENKDWLNLVKNKISQEEMEPGQWISWAASHASIAQPRSTPPAHSTCCLSSWNPLQAQRWLSMLSQAINFINPGQTPVVEADQPLFQLAKKIQWKYPETEIGESSFLVTLGAMHTENASECVWRLAG